MEPWHIRPFDRVGSLKFQMSRSSIQELLGSEFRAFRKTPRSESETDGYDHLGLHLYYDIRDELNYIEAFPQCPLLWNQVQFFQNDLTTTIDKMGKLGQSAVRDPSGCYFAELGVSIYSPRAERIESVGVFRRDKWEDYLRLLGEIAAKNRLRAEHKKVGSPFQPDEKK